MKIAKARMNRYLAASLTAAALVFGAPLGFANTELWVGTNSLSVTTNWSDNLNWTNLTGTGGAGPNGNDVVFSDSGAALGAGIVDSVVDISGLNPFSLTFTNNSTAGNYHTLLIPGGVNVTNANALTVGVRLSPVTAFATTVAVVGSGTLVQNGATVQIDDSMTSSATGSGQTATLDLSGLTNFIFINTNSGSSLTVAGTSSGSEARNGGVLNLAAVSNYITVSNLNVALGSGNSGPGGVLNFGTGTNILNVANINLAAGKINNATLKFFGATGGLRIRGFSGADSDRNVTMVLGNRSSSGTGTPTGTLNFLGGYPIDVKVNSVTMGKSNQTGAGAANISFDTGTFDATTINMATTSNTGGVTSAITVSGGRLLVNNLSMANQSSTGAALGGLAINGPGMVICSNSIIKTTTAGTASITNNPGGTLIVATGIGSATNAIDNFVVADSTLTVPAGLTATVYATNLIASGTTNTINVTSVPTFFTYPAQFPIISYINALGDNTTFTNGTLPGTYQGYISNNVNNLSIDLVITNGPFIAPLKSIKWNGTPTGDWSTNTSVLNWLTNTTPANYNQGDTVTFDDTLTGTTNVNLTMALTPTDLTINNSSAHYIFTGIGSIGGETALTKTGTGTLIIDNSGTNNFAGGVSIAAGGTLQVGNNDANGSLPPGNWDNEGTLAFSRSDNITISTVITGAGSLVQNGNGTLSLSAAETYSGSTIISKGTLALIGGASVASTAAIYPSGGAFDVSAASPSLALNPVGLANGGNLVVGTNTISTTALSTTNSTITLAPTFGVPSIATTALTTGGTTNYINITRIFGVDPSTPPPVVIPIITYGPGSFNGAFNFGETNFPNAYVTNDTANNSIDLVLTASPYSVTWNGGSLSDNNWSDPANWSGTTIFPNDNLTFDGSTRLNTINDTAAGTTYSNITFNSTAGAFTLSGNPITLTGAIANDSANTQAVNLAVNFTGNAATLNGLAGPLIIGGGITNVGPSGSSLTLMGTGILTNLFGSTGATNALIENDFNGNWTLLDNGSSATDAVPLAVEINNGTFNFGSASSAPNFMTTSPQGVPQDNQVGANGGTAVLNMSNGVFTTSARLNTGASGSGASGTINQYGGTINIASQFQGANASGATSAVNLYGGTMNIGGFPTSSNSGPFYVASRGNSSLTITNSALLNCGTLDVSRAIIGSVSGTVNLDGGTIVASSVTAASANSVSGNTGDTATFNFNGGLLKARGSSATFFEGHYSLPVVPVTAYVQTGGAIIDSSTNSITFLEPLLTDPNLAGAPDGGLTKLGNGTLTLAGTNTYIGNTTVSAGTLLVNGINGASQVTVSSGGTLGGLGVVGSNVIVNAGGTIAAGTPASIGTLTVDGNVTINGTVTARIDKTANANDLLQATNIGATTITYGGTLNIVVTNGSMALNDTFPLFNATNYAGSFSSITPATPGPGLAWNTSFLTVNGTISVMSSTGGPTTNVTITTVTLSGTNMLIHGTNNNVPNNTGRFVVFGSTNLSAPLSSWTPLSTNTYNSTGTLDYTNPIVPGTPRQFLIIQAIQ